MGGNKGGRFPASMENGQDFLLRSPCPEVFCGGHGKVIPCWGARDTGVFLLWGQVGLEWGDAGHWDEGARDQTRERGDVLA